VNGAGDQGSKCGASILRQLQSKEGMMTETLARRIDPDVVVQFNLKGEKVYRFSDGSEVKGG
jgi:hypothetical protein